MIRVPRERGVDGEVGGMQGAPSLQWSEPVVELVGFVSLFVANGAVGFRYAAVRDRLAAVAPADPTRTIYESAVRRAAALGLLGALAQAALLATRLPRLAARMHLTTSQLLTTDPQTIVRCALLLLALVGFALAATRRSGAWPIAAIGLIGAELANVLSGRWNTLVNPVHQLLAGLWLGTLLVLVVAGIGRVFRDGSPTLRGSVVADMVNGFSPLALVCGPLLVLTGVTTALLHLRPFSSLWTTPYGYALLVKLALVAVVFGLGAWNWQRQRPQLGSADAAERIRRSSITELTFAALILVVTSVLVSLPAPRPPRPAQPPAVSP